eukprot:TRINITY_DN112536_c0_g1_i1.p1 TRINITY_DN112536_c0_g1~~TRINITY_DN112536_c0_g1_i1.p1  ORF type:complete len:176 (+),score=12.33 TRINITY_DN112536_c0_g1_i1:134-661(+)
MARSKKEAKANEPARRRILKRERQQRPASAPSTAVSSRNLSERDRRIYSEIMKYATSSELLIPKGPFIRLVREITAKLVREEFVAIRNALSPAAQLRYYETQGKQPPSWEPGVENPFRFETQALICLHEAAEAFLVGLFEDASCCTVHCRRKTLMQKDFLLTNRLRARKPLVPSG